MEQPKAICEDLSQIITNPHAVKRPFSMIVWHTQHCACCDPKIVAAAIANTIFSPRLLRKMQHA